MLWDKYITQNKLISDRKFLLEENDQLVTCSCYMNISQL